MELEFVDESASPFCCMTIYRACFEGRSLRVIDEAVSGQIFVYHQGARIATLSSGKRFYSGLPLGEFVSRELTQGGAR